MYCAAGGFMTNYNPRSVVLSVINRAAVHKNAWALAVYNAMPVLRARGF